MSEIRHGTRLADNIRKVRFTREEEAALIARAQAGCKKAEDDLLHSVAPFVLRVAKAFSTRWPWVPIEDAYQDGLVSVLKLIHRFDLKRGKRLITPVKQSAWSLMMNGRPAHHRGMSIPCEAMRQASLGSGKPYAEAARRVMSSEFYPMDNHAGDHAYGDDYVQDIELADEVEFVLSSLPESERVMICELFGVGGYRKVSEAEYAARKGVRPNRVGDAKRQILAKIRADQRIIAKRAG